DRHHPAVLHEPRSAADSRTRHSPKAPGFHTCLCATASSTNRAVSPSLDASTSHPLAPTTPTLRERGSPLLRDSERVRVLGRDELQNSQAFAQTTNGEPPANANVKSCRDPHFLKATERKDAHPKTRTKNFLAKAIRICRALQA